MRTSAVLFAKESMIPSIRDDNAPEQAANVACLPGIVGKALAMPDIHWGYGFPIGGVAAFDAETGVISPGGIGFDINCGVRCVLTNLHVSEVRPRIKEIIGELFKNVPAGVGSEGVTDVAAGEIDNILNLGGRWAVEKGYGWEEDLDATEEGGQMKNADTTKVSRKAKERGIPQVGSLGSGNHFLEVDEVSKIYDPVAAKAFGITGEGQITVTIHCGSRGCGHQIATDYLQVMERHLREKKLELPDRQLACAEINSTAGQDYFTAMAAGANFAWANRQMILHWTRQSFESVFNRTAEELGMHQLYDVAHNIAKLEEHEVEGKKMKVIVHRKGATRSFPRDHPDVPLKYREVGQPVIIPGDMGAGSYILVGTQQTMKEAFGSTCHGAGRLMSRAAATRLYNVQEVRRRMEQQGIYLKASTKDGILEEAPGAYKDIDQVISVVEGAGLSQPVARLKPVGVMKG
jgi:tRNA-splicing ligase RtcB